MSQVKVGSSAPVFQLPDQSGNLVDFQQIIGKDIFILFFYPKDFTAICTAEVCAFRDSYEDFLNVGARVFGISSDSTKRHEDFAQQHRLPFQVLSDEKGKIRKLWGVPKSLGLIPGRVTYVVDAQGIIRHIFSAQLASNGHVEEAIRIVNELVA